MLVEPATVPEGGDRLMLSFETLSYAPIDRRLIDVALLSSAEIAWLDAYHGKVFELLRDALDRTERRWLRDATQPLL